MDMPENKQEYWNKLNQEVENRLIWGPPKRFDTPDLTLKYFTPEISDIRVGYECETQVDPYPNWVKTKIEDGDCLNYIINNDWQIRVPYLTREQIEAEGWVNCKPLVRYPNAYEKDNYFLLFFRDYTIDIIMKDLVKDDYICHTSNGRVFAGKVKDINTFRQLMKLLNIT